LWIKQAKFDVILGNYFESWVSKTKQILGFEPKVDFIEGVQRLHNWLAKQEEKTI